MRKMKIKFFLNTRKKSTKTGNTPVYVLITINGDRSSAKLPIELKPNEIKHWSEQFERLSIKGHPVNKLIDKITHRFDSVVSLEYDRISLLTAKELKDDLLNPNKKKLETRFIPFMWEYYQEEIVGSSKYAPGTRGNYLKAFRHMDKFALKSKKLTFQHIDYKFANAFKNYLLKPDPDKNKKAMAEVSALGIIKKFRKLIKHAIKLDLMDKNPFSEVKLSDDTKEKENFPLSELNLLFNTESLNIVESKHSLVFQFMVLTGCSYSDCQSLTKENLKFDYDGTRLNYRRLKTKNLSSQYLSDQAVGILRQLDDPKSSYLMPRVANQHLNRMLKIIGLKQGVSRPLNSHMGRAIYRQLLNEAGLVKSMTIDKLMGWSSRSKIESRYMTVTEGDLIEAKHKLNTLLFSIFSQEMN